MGLPQLLMRFTAFDKIPEMYSLLGSLPNGLTLTTHQAGDEADWEILLGKCFDEKMSFKDSMYNFSGYQPEYLFYIVRDGKKIASAAAVENISFPNEGWVHYVGVDPEARGMKLGKHVILAVLNSFRERGFKSAVLSTDDHRLPAIKTYLDLGFEPIFSYESHTERWAEVREKLK